MINIEQADRLKQLPPYLFAELDRKKAEAREKGVDVIDLGVGDPDLPTPDNIINKLTEAAREPRYHRYPSYTGMNNFREAVARWYKKRADVDLHPVAQKNQQFLHILATEENPREKLVFGILPRTVPETHPVSGEIDDFFGPNVVGITEADGF